MPKVKRVLLVGNRGGTNVGGSFERAAVGLGIKVGLVESMAAMEGNRWLRTILWHCGGHRPIRLKEFSAALVSTCREMRPCVLISTGVSPITEEALAQIRRMGTVCANYLTDDPWNPAHHAEWFIDALRAYDHVFTTKRSHMSDLLRVTNGEVAYLRFGYDPALFFPERARLGADADIVFAGGADKDRIPYMASLIKAKLSLKLYGSYWEKYRTTKGWTRGQIGVEQLRRELASSRVALCLVRRANRDDHCMRTFEVPAVGTCMMTEDTAEHRTLFGEEGHATMYFGSPEEAAEKALFLVRNERERTRLGTRIHEVVTNGWHTYRDRLTELLKKAGFVV